MEISMFVWISYMRMSRQEIASFIHLELLEIGPLKMQWQIWDAPLELLIQLQMRRQSQQQVWYFPLFGHNLQAFFIFEELEEVNNYYMLWGAMVL